MSSKSMAGWIGFAGILMLIIGAIAFIQGLIALFDDEWQASGYSPGRGGPAGSRSWS
jgi:hypothetical protein